VWWTHDAVRDALADAAEKLDRHERRLGPRLKISGIYSQVLRNNRADGQGEADGHAADVIEPLTDREVRRVRPLTAVEIDEMERVNGWIEWLPEGDDRRLVGAASLMIGEQGRHVDWVEIKRQVRSARSPNALRVRYSRALTQIARRLNH
jgi:hypothetical protein